MPATSEKISRFVPSFAGVVIAAFLLREVVDADTWWQVAIGRDILDHFAIPLIDRFSAAGMGRPYHDSHWLFQVMLALSDRVAGMAGVSLIMALLWGLTFAISYRTLRNWLDPVHAGILLFVTAIACSDRFTPRPDIITCLMIAIFYRALLHEWERSLKAAAAIFILQIVWANSHGLFVIGPFMVGCTVIGSILKDRGNTGKIWRSSLILGLTLIASCLTPFGIDGWRYAMLLATEAGAGGPEFFSRIAELAPTFGVASLRFPDFWAYLLLLTLAVAGCVPAIIGKRLDYGRFLIVAGLCAAALTGRRNIPLFALAAAPLIAENLTASFRNYRVPRYLSYVAIAVMLLAASLPLSGRYYQWLGYPIRFGTGATPSYFPAELPKLLKSSGFAGQIYNANYLGGFLLYHGYLPLTDGRWELYDPRELDRIFAAPRDPMALSYLLSRYSVAGILMQHTCAEAGPLLPKLAKDNGWRLVYLDHAASFWVRADIRFPHATLDYSQPVAAGRFASRVEDYLMLATFYKLVGSWNAAEAVARQGLTVGGKRGELLAVLGGAQRDAGRSADAEATFRELLREEPRNAQALNELAFFAYSRGDAGSALQYLRRAVAVSPRDTAARANMERIERGLLVHGR